MRIEKGKGTYRLIEINATNSVHADKAAGKVLHGDLELPTTAKFMKDTLSSQEVFRHREIACQCALTFNSLLRATTPSLFYPDHAGGNEDLVKMIPGLKVYGGDERIGALTEKVQHDTKFKIGELNVQCLFTPCHTAGHICYYVTSSDETDKAVFTGDTLFLGGCGRFFEGTADQMYNALIKILSNLPDPTQVFCGHEYTLQNLRFASHVEPENEALNEKIMWSEQQRNEGKPTVPSTIGEEKLYNPFMRVTEPAVQKYANANEPIETMKTIRQKKDNFKG
ncbi:Hydroxyacylglutathione hydrolase, mitochondrial [Eumeta japonica]|uniref:hydroxyacylglutathione hydrolase n=1 Tax=Eumeta variegata TaxID=151549 RepID=A0A4C1Y7G5_EUMVA|nr:Hydroxyacylglutathione hydrolase, mitochondrial [Eumeta japonica]